MRVAVYEPDSTGHHFAYLAHVMPALAELPCEPVLLTTAEAAASADFVHHLAPHANRLTVDTSLTVFAKKRALVPMWKQWTDMVRAVRQLEVDHLWVACGDGLVQLAGLDRLIGRRPLPASLESEVLVLRGGYTYGASNLQKRIQARFSPYLIRIGPWGTIHHLNPDDLAILQNAGGDMRARCRLMPDPVEPPVTATKTQARRELRIPEAGRYIGCTGMIDKRKGIDLLLGAFLLAARQLDKNDRMLLAGPIAPEIRTLLDRQFADDLRQARVVLLDRPLSGREMNLALAALDVACTPYPTHIHAASIVIRAAAVGRPVLGSAIGWMRRTIDEFRLGRVCDVTDHERFAAAIVECLDAADSYVPTEASRRLAAFHSPCNFVAHWTARLRERLGLPPLDRIEWEWVTAALPL
jgi:glycosyltransferase involved in cell wall biosynthesis